MKRTTVVLPLLLPRLSDQAAAQLIDLLRALIDALDHHYAEQIHRYRKRERDRQLNRYPCPSPSKFDPPF